ncbi:MAG: hypothetical protein HZA19_03275 [Nitrospirae bacterium]|nr:hypothetical protein [Nitrospirota bacterium]
MKFWLRPVLAGLAIFLLRIGAAHAEPLHDTSAVREYPPGWVHSLTSRFYVADEERSFIEGQSGLALRNGANLLLFEDGGSSIGKNLLVYYQLKQTFNTDGEKNEFFRGYLKYYFSKFSLEAGKDNVNLGPGEYGLLLSNQAPPYPLLIFQTEEPLRFWGRWDLLLLHGWLIEEREDVSDPNILALRVIWRPWNFLEIGGTRTTQFGGEGRRGFTLTEYPVILIGYREHDTGKYDNEGYAGYDISLHLTSLQRNASIQEAKLYFEHAATDFTAVWQKDRKETDFPLPFGFAFRHEGFVGGFFLSTPQNIFRLEYAKTDAAWYSHHQYPVEGYTYKGFSLGYPYGTDLESLFLKHKHYFNDSFSVEYRIGGYQQPITDANKPMKRYYGSILAEKERRNFTTAGYLRWDKADHYDADPLPNQFSITDENKTFYTVGISGGWRF